MEAFHGDPRWRASAPMGHRRGGIHSADRGSFNNHLGPPRQNHPHVFDGNWGRSSGEVWKNGDDYSWEQYPHTNNCENDLPGPMENRYNNQWTGGGGGGGGVGGVGVGVGGGQGQMMPNHPRMDFPPRRSMNGHWRGRKAPRFYHGHHPVRPSSPSSIHFPYSQQQHDISSPSDQEPRQLGSSLSSFPSPSSTESESSSHLSPHLSRDPRQRSHMHTASRSPLYNFQDKSISTSYEYHQSSYHNNHSMASYNQDNRHFRHNVAPTVQNTSYQHYEFEPPSSFSPHQVNNVSNSSGTYYEGKGRTLIPGHVQFSKESERYGYHNHVHQQPTHSVPQRPPIIKENTIISRPLTLASDRLKLEHCYYNKLDQNNSTAKPLYTGSLQRTLTPSTNNDIPLPIVFDDYNDYEDANSRKSHFETVGKDCVESFINEEVSMETSSQNATDDCIVNSKEDDPSLVVSTLDTTKQANGDDDGDIFSISPLSLNGFEMDIDTEIESLASSSPSSSLTDSKHSVSLCVSLPLSKVSLPTNILLKLPTINSSQAKDIYPVGDRPTGKERVLTRESLAKQQSDTIQLRNRALPRRNLYLFASRKSSPKVKNDIIANEIDSDDNRDNKRIARVSTSDDSVIADNNGIDHDIHESSKDYTNNEVDESNYVDTDGTESTCKRSKSPSSKSPSSNYSIKVVSKRTQSPEISPNNKKKGKFQDFVPVVLKARSRAETKTIQRRQTMVIQMQKNEKERKSTALSDENDEDGIPYRTRRRTRKREMISPINSVDDSSSIMSESVSNKEQETQQGNAEYSPDLVRRYKRWLLQAKDRSGSGDSPLHHACRNGKHDVLCYLLTNVQCSVNVQDNAGWTPLHEACNKGHKDIVKALLQHGADPNIPATDGTRPIHDAVEAGNFEIVTILVEHGADPMVEYSERTPIEIAKSANFQEIVAYLSEICEKRKQSSQHSPVDQQEHIPTRNTTALSTSSISDNQLITLPVDGYSESLLGPELDHPMFFVSATIEMSSVPMLPLYNITVSSGPNPRRHNFHILDDVLEHLDTEKETLLSHLGEVNTFSISIGEFIAQVKSNQLTKSAKILKELKSVDKSSKLELIPLSSALRNLMSIEVENIDD